MKTAGKTSILHSESGMVSIFVSIIMILIITLVVLGFTQIARRNQRTTADSHLSTQAYYAAESGVNDAAAAIKSLGAAAPAKDTCADKPAPYNFNASGKSTLVAGEVSYTCVLIDPTPSSLPGSIGSDSKVFPLISADGSAFSSITLTWYPEQGHESDPMSGCYSTANLGKFPVASGAGVWGCKFAALRTDLVKGTSFSRAGWPSSTQANILEPVNSTTIVNLPFTPGNSDNDGSIGQPACSDTSPLPTCKITITGGLGLNAYYLRISALYHTANIIITAKNTAGADVKFKNAQALVDVTGKAFDTLRRIQVSVDLTDANTRIIPNAALASGDSICKRFSVTPGYFNNDNYEGDGGNPLCQDATVGTPSP